MDINHLLYETCPNRKAKMKKTIISLALLGVLTLACNLPFQVTLNTPAETPTGAPSDLALTVTAQAQLLANTDNADTPKNNATQSEPPSTAAEATNTPIPLPTTTPSLAVSPTPNNTATSSTLMVSVSLDTNCRTGPGKAYDIVGALLVGESAEVTGKNTSSGYWIVKNPDNPSKTCWLWGQYASVAGNTASLAEVSVPPTPTPVIPAAPSNLSQSSICYAFITGVSSHKSDITLSWQDNSSNEDGFKIYLKANYITGSVFIPIGTVGTNQTSYSFNAIHYASANDVKFKVEAFNSAGATMSAEISLDPSSCP